MNANQWKQALFSHSEGENTRTSASTEYPQQYNARQRKTNWGIEAIKVGMDETGVSGFFCSSSF